MAASKDGKTLHLESTAPFYFRALEEGRDFVFRATPLIEVSTSDSWQDFLRPAAERFGSLLAEPLPDKAKSLVSGLDKLTEAERVRRVLADVRQRIRYMGDWRETVHGYVPFSLAEIESRGFGDCKDMAITTTGLLRAAGIQANVAIVRAGNDDRKPLLPTLSYLNHAIVRATVNGKAFWLDPTSPANALSAPLFYLQNQVAFVLHDDGKVDEEVIPVSDALRDRIVSDVDLTPEGENWVLTGSERREGVAAADLVREEKSGKNQDTTLAKGLIPSTATLVDQSITREADPSNPLIDLYSFKAKVSAKRVALPSGPYQQIDYRFLTTTIGEFREYLAKDGVSDFHLSASSSDRTIRIHQRQMLEPAKACEVKSPWVDFRVEPVAVEAGVGFRAVLAKKVNWILASDMKTKAFADAVDQLELCANNMLLLLKMPL